MSGHEAVIQALAQALQKEPHSPVLWKHYAELLLQDGRWQPAADALRKVLELDPGMSPAEQQLVSVLLRLGQLSEALIRAEALLAKEENPGLRLELARVLHARGDDAAAAAQYRQARGDQPELRDETLEALIAGRPTAAGSPGASEPEPDADGDAPADPDLEDFGETSPLEADEEDGLLRATVGREAAEPQDLAAEFDAGDLYVTFGDVAGLEDVKKQITLRIIAPFKNKEIYQAFRRSGGGGILLYGPPGCGKTFIARATAGECSARFVSVGIHTILDKYYGESERLIHALFEDARRRAPTVLFFDEFDALGAARSRSESQFWRTLVDQLLQEMDGVSGKNTDVLVFAATNLPWNVDAAFRRPGRFDRSLFVPPPDLKARISILRQHSAKLPGAEQIDVTALGKATTLFTGADLKALCERASEDALARSLESGAVHPVAMADFERARVAMQSSAEEWLATARNYARYANQGGQFDELADFLKAVKRWT